MRIEVAGRIAMMGFIVIFAGALMYLSGALEADQRRGLGVILIVGGIAALLVGIVARGGRSGD